MSSEALFPLSARRPGQERGGTDYKARQTDQQYHGKSGIYRNPGDKGNPKRLGYIRDEGPSVHAGEKKKTGGGNSMCDKKERRQPMAKRSCVAERGKKKRGPQCAKGRGHRCNNFYGQAGKTGPWRCVEGTRWRRRILGKRSAPGGCGGGSLA